MSLMQNFTDSLAKPLVVVAGLTAPAAQAAIVNFDFNDTDGSNFSGDLQIDTNDLIETAVFNNIYVANPSSYDANFSFNGETISTPDCINDGMGVVMFNDSPNDTLTFGFNTNCGQQFGGYNIDQIILSFQGFDGLIDKPSDVLDFNDLFNFEGVVGTYNISFDDINAADINGLLDFEVDTGATPVNAPGTLPLLVVAGAGLLASRRRREPSTENLAAPAPTVG